jgi:hypothetical protein
MKRWRLTRMSERKEKREINVKVDNKTTLELWEKNKQLTDMLQNATSEKEDLQEKLAIIGKQAFEEKKRALSAPDSITTPSQLKLWEEEHGNEDDGGTDDNVGSGGAGSVPLRGNQQVKKNKTYDSRKNLVDDLLRMEREGTPQEKEYASGTLNKLFKKQMNSLKRDNDGERLNFADAEKEYANEPIVGEMQKRLEKQFRELEKNGK